MNILVYSKTFTTYKVNEEQYNSNNYPNESILMLKYNNPSKIDFETFYADLKRPLINSLHITKL
jgi:hypothetical protein